MTNFDADRERQRIAEATRAEAYRGVGRLQMNPVMPVDVPEHLVDVGVSFDDRLIVVGTDAIPSESFAARQPAAPDEASFPYSMAPTAYLIDVDIIPAPGGDAGSGRRERRRIDGVTVANPKVQACSNGELLVVGARSRWIDGAGEHNAFVYGVDGAAQTSFCIGDGVALVQVTPSDRVWVGYFDEGVFGNFGWGAGRGPDPLGSSGLVCWSLVGERQYEFSPPKGFGLIDDCYAMSVADETVWACYYSGFPIVSVDADFEATAWVCGVDGAGSIAVGDGCIALIGGYRGLFDRIVIIDMVSDQLADLQILQLVMPDGTDLPADTKIVARGRFVHALVGGQWLRLDLSEPIEPR